MHTGFINKLKRNSGFLYILPSFILITIFSLIPLLMTFYFSFTKYNVINAPEWIGLDNFSRMLKDGFFTASVKNTIIYTVITVPLQTLISLVIANEIAQRFRGKFGALLRGSLFIPVISSMILVGVIWKFLLATESGMVNQIIQLFGLSGLNWLGDTQLAMISICIVSIWKNVGYFLVIYYAGIMDIPRSQYEAAEVDGASRFQQFRYITIPSLKPITYLVVTLGTIWSFQVFDLVYTMTGGGPGRSTSTLVLMIYQNGFKYYQMGYASAISFALFILILILLAIQNFAFRDKTESKKGG